MFVRTCFLNQKTKHEILSKKIFHCLRLSVVPYLPQPNFMINNIIRMKMTSKRIVGLKIMKRSIVVCWAKLVFQFYLVFSREPRLYERVCPSVRPLVRPSVGLSVTSFFGGQKRRRRTTYFVYTNLFLG